MARRKRKPSLATYARQANAHHRVVVASGAAAVDHMIACGKILGRAKGEIGDERWADWLGNHIDADPSTARTYMRLHLDESRAMDLLDDVRAGKATHVDVAALGPAWRCMTEELRRRIAHHEAGHAIVAVALGLVIRHVLLFNTGPVDGRVDLDVCDGRCEPSPWAAIALTLAGVSAECAVFGGTVDLDARRRIEAKSEATEISDLHVADRIARQVYASARGARRGVRQALARVDRWLRLPGPASCVRELAGILVAGEPTPVALTVAGQTKQLEAGANATPGQVVYDCAKRHGVHEFDQRLLPRGRKFWRTQT